MALRGHGLALEQSPYDVELLLEDVQALLGQAERVVLLLPVAEPQAEHEATLADGVECRGGLRATGHLAASQRMPEHTRISPPRPSAREQRHELQHLIRLRRVLAGRDIVEAERAGESHLPRSRARSGSAPSPADAAQMVDAQPRCHRDAPRQMSDVHLERTQQRAVVSRGEPERRREQQVDSNPANALSQAESTSTGTAGSWRAWPHSARTAIRTSRPSGLSGKTASSFTRSRGRVHLANLARPAHEPRDRRGLVGRTASQPAPARFTVRGDAELSRKLVRPRTSPTSRSSYPRGRREAPPQPIMAEGRTIVTITHGLGDLGLQQGRLRIRSCQAASIV
jgi:hypothetical protein